MKKQIYLLIIVCSLFHVYKSNGQLSKRGKTELHAVRSDKHPAKADEIKLIVRADDIGFCHAVNLACIKTYKEGIARSVEVIVPSPWFPEAVKMLKENPGYDVGVHLCLTSEWLNLKWRPLTCAPSLTDKDGYFFPFVWKNNNYPPGSFLLESKYDLKELEQELRAQIEMAKKYIPNLTHLSAHMGAATSIPQISAITEKLAKEYNLPINVPGAKHIENFGGARKSPEEKEKDLVEILKKLTAGTWIIVEHPGFDTEEMKTIGHIGYENVGYDREGVTQAFTSEKVKAVIQERNIKLISIKEALNDPK